MIELTTGDLLASGADALVNPVNCDGVMGRGLAAQFKRAFPAMFESYRGACKRGELVPGRMHIVEVGARFIIDFPTKRHWKSKSRIEDIDAGLVALVADVQRLEIRSIAIPPLGCGSVVSTGTMCDRGSSARSGPQPTFASCCSRLHRIRRDRAAFNEVQNEIEAMPPESLGRITTDVPTAVSLSLGALPQIEAIVPRMSELLKKPPVVEIERLRARALVLLHAHLRWVPSTNALDADLEEARVLREQLLAAADAHVSFGHLDAGAMAAIREGAGHLDRANDLIVLSALLRAVWDGISKRTLVTEAQLERATVLGTLLIAQLGGKSLGTLSPSGKSWADVRVRAFRLFMNDYDEIRRAVEYVRYDEGDAAQFAPSLHPRLRGGSDEASAPEENASPGTPA